MGLVGVIVSGSAGCLSVALSLLAIRRNVCKRKCRNQKRTTALRLTAATGVTATPCPTDNAGAGARNSASIKSTRELVRKRRAATVQTHCGEPTARTGSYDYAISNSYGINRNERNRCHQDVDDAMVANNVVHKHAENTTVLHQGTQNASSPLKEFTVVGSNSNAGSDQSAQDPEEEDYFKSKFAEDWNTRHQSCSETESCSFADDQFFSEEEFVRTAEDEGSADTMDIELESPQPCQKGAKRVSFQLANSVGEQRDMYNSRADHENPVAENVLAIENLLHTEDVEILPGNEDVHNETFWGQSYVPGQILEAMDQRVLMGVGDTLARTQEYSERSKSEQGNAYHVGQRDKTPAKARKPLFVSAEPLAEMPVLRDALNLSPTPSSPEAKGYPISCAVDAMPSEPNKNSKDSDERHSTSAAQLQKGYSQESYRSSDDEKENDSCSPASSPERLSRKPRREVERAGMFRRSSYSSLRRFRFSDRIKVRPLRSSGRNSK